MLQSYSLRIFTSKTARIESRDNSKTLFEANSTKMKRMRFGFSLLILFLFAVLYFYIELAEERGKVEHTYEKVGRSSNYIPHKVRATATKTGAWNLPDNYEYYFDESLASSLVQHFWKEKRSWGRPDVLEFGSGTGKYINYFRSNKIHARGYDGVSDIHTRSGGTVDFVDLTEQVSVGSADFVVCLEVAEHIPKVYEEIFLQNIVTHCKHSLILSWAPPSQGGVGHVNMKERADVIELLSMKGFHINEAATSLLLHAAVLPWFKENLMVFERSDY